jgi:hypothetical protein
LIRATVLATLALAAAAAALVLWSRDMQASTAPSVEVDSAVEHVTTSVRATTETDAPPAARPRPVPRKMHAVLIKTFPVGAVVTVDGRSFGTTPTYAKVPANTPVELHVRRAGYQPIVRKLTSKTPTDRVFLKLAPAKRRR